MVTALAIHYLGLVRMKCKTACVEPLCKNLFQSKCFSLTGTVAYYVISITLKLYATPVPCNPYVKGIVQEQIGQQGTYHTPLCEVGDYAK